jgi:hypothetical protein
MVALYRERGYDGIVVTNHLMPSYAAAFESPEVCADDFVRGFSLAKAAGHTYGLRVFLGAELRFRGNANDFLLYGLLPEQLPEIIAFMLSPQSDMPEFWERWHDELVIVQAHPLRRGCTPVNARFVHGIEVLNTHHDPSYNHKAEQYYALHPELLAIAGCDAHYPEDVGGTAVLFPSLPENGLELAGFLRDNRFIIESF